jgi:hypothetical protein
VGRRAPFIGALVPNLTRAPLSVFRFVIIKICIIPLMARGETQQRVRSGWPARARARARKGAHKFRVKGLSVSFAPRSMLINARASVGIAQLISPRDPRGKLGR